MAHIVLLGDSIFDNKVYVGGEPDVVEHLRDMIPAGWAATLCARDGAVTRDVPAQIASLPADATHLVLSVGGNDALENLYLLEDPSLLGPEILSRLAAAVVVFGQSYRAVLERLGSAGLPLMVCTIYNGNLEAAIAQAARAAVAVYDDTIYSAASEAGVPVLELRRICTGPSDYANPVEPSSSGGRKIAKAILDCVEGWCTGW
jgi:hypothetical protein